MRHEGLKHSSRITKCNVRVWALLLVLVILGPPNNANSQFLTPSTTQLQPSRSPSSKINLLQPQALGLHEVVETKFSNSTNSGTHMSMDEVEMYLATHRSEAFDGYNIFVFHAENRKDPILTGKGNRILVVTNMEGEIISQTEPISFPKNVWVFYVRFINSTTLLYGRKGMDSALWNMYTNKTVNLNSIGPCHHDHVYNPINNTFFTLTYLPIEINGTRYLFDKIVEFNTVGQVVWSLDTRSFINPSQWCPYRDMMNEEVDLTHANSLFFDPDEDIIYLNIRNVNTFYKIDHKTGRILWGLGEYGNFTLFDRHANPRHNLFYHAHAVEKVDDNTFIMFDNDYHNQTKIANHRSRLLEITINETIMTAHESWAWTAPPDYFSVGFGDADRLPNGNRLGVFGTRWHLNEETDPIGARLVEVTAAGEIVWELNFLNNEQLLYSVYRMERFHLSPILNSPPDLRALPTDDVTVSWQTWYNFRTAWRVNGSFTLYLNGAPIETAQHTFDKYWRPTNLTVHLGKLALGDYNLTLALADEAGHITTDSVNISIVPFYLTRVGPLTIELEQENALIQWKGRTSKPFLATLTRNETQLVSFIWNGSIIPLDLNSFRLGTYFVTLTLFDSAELIYTDSFLVHIYPVSFPTIHSFPADQYITWNTSLILFWELFNPFPAWWNILVNDRLTAWGPWDTPNYLLNWRVPLLDEGVYNVTMVAYNHVGRPNSSTTWLTVLSPNFPIIIPRVLQVEFHWGEEDAYLLWEVHGGTHWTLWKNETAAYNGTITNNEIAMRIENWQRHWPPGTYNLTMQVTNAEGVETVITSWVLIWVDVGDAYGNSIIPEVSMWYYNGENALGPPDGMYARLYADYGNGHVTLDMGVNEEIINGKGNDVMVYAQGGEYIVFVGNNLSAQAFIGTSLSAPLILLGTGLGNTSFNLGSIDLDQVRYIQIVSLTDEEVELDAVMAIYSNQPPRPASIYELWKVPIFGGGSYSHCNGRFLGS